MHTPFTSELVTNTQDLWQDISVTLGYHNRLQPLCTIVTCHGFIYCIFFAKEKKQCAKLSKKCYIKNLSHRQFFIVHATYTVSTSLTFVGRSLHYNGSVLCYTSCILTTLHCIKVSYLQFCSMKRYNKIIYTKM